MNRKQTALHGQVSAAQRGKSRGRKHESLSPTRWCRRGVASCRACYLLLPLLQSLDFPGSWVHSQVWFRLVRRHFISSLWRQIRMSAFLCCPFQRPVYLSGFCSCWGIDVSIVHLKFGFVWFLLRFSISSFCSLTYPQSMDFFILNLNSNNFDFFFLGLVVWICLHQGVAVLGMASLE